MNVDRSNQVKAQQVPEDVIALQGKKRLRHTLAQLDLPSIAKKGCVGKSVSRTAPVAPICQARGDLENINETCPHAFIMSFMKSQGLAVKVRSSLSIKTDFFANSAQGKKNSYGHAAIRAIRTRDIEALRKLVEGGLSLQSSNSFGESLIHMACRRSLTEVVRFLVTEGGVSLRVRDDYGRTPLHDACWTCEPNYQLMKLLLREVPELVLLSDKRGHTPFQYVRKAHWKQWVEFLVQNSALLIPQDRSRFELFAGEKSWT